MPKTSYSLHKIRMFKNTPPSIFSSLTDKKQLIAGARDVPGESVCLRRQRQLSACDGENQGKFAVISIKNAKDRLFLA
ncbi:hypothetical protein [Undibacterium sp. WLHG33]|uniref:hypothetical protein n=1 Tax=Undibacterium sp. WLHG33 TaxID=3412482 RepID=UPI003C2E38EF